MDRRIAILLSLLPLTLACSEDGAMVEPAATPAVTGHGEQALPNGMLRTMSFHPPYGDLDGATASQTPGGTWHLAVNAGGDIPRFPDAFILDAASPPVFGYAWVDLGSGEGVVAVIHPRIGRDSNQNPDGWHTHPVVLTGGAAFDFCVASIGTVKTTGSQGGLRIHGDILELTISGKQTEATGFSAGASFVVWGDAGCPATGLGVQVLSVSPLS